MKVAIYPGSFDPVTYGHIDIIKRSIKIFDHLIVAILSNVKKKSLFTLNERVKMLKTILKNMKKVEIGSFDGLLVDYMKKREATILIRGLRAVSDFEYEFQMAHMNHKLYPEMETIFMMTGEEYSYISSQLVKEVFSLGGDVSFFVPPLVVKRLKEKIKS